LEEQISLFDNITQSEDFINNMSKSLNEVDDELETNKFDPLAPYQSGSLSEFGLNIAGEQKFVGVHYSFCQ